MAGRRRSDRALRNKLHSPGRPPVARQEHLRRFWTLIAGGLSSEDAALGAGMSAPVGARWFRKAGGMPPSTLAPSLKPSSGRYLTFAEREELAIQRAQGAGVRAIARQMGRSGSTISRELRRNAATRGGALDYRATTAQWHAERAARRPKPAKLALNAMLRAYVQDRLAGIVVAPSGAAVLGPTVLWKGRRHGPRKERRWASAWSPEQIAHRLQHDFPHDGTMRISHEAIYQSLYVQGRGALRRELTACLRTGRALRVPRARSQGRGKSFIVPEVMISERPAEVADRAVPGHWRRPHSRIGQFRDRHLGGADDAVHDVVAFAANAGARCGSSHKERPSACRAWRRGRPRQHRLLDHQLARATPTIADLGSGRGDVTACTTED